MNRNESRDLDNHIEAPDDETIDYAPLEGSSKGMRVSDGVFVAIVPRNASEEEVRAALERARERDKYFPYRNPAADRLSATREGETMPQENTATAQTGRASVSNLATLYDTNRPAFNFGQIPIEDVDILRDIDALLIDGQGDVRDIAENVSGREIRSLLLAIDHARNEHTRRNEILGRYLDELASALHTNADAASSHTLATPMKSTGR